MSHEHTLCTAKEELLSIFSGDFTVQRLSKRQCN